MNHSVLALAAALGLVAASCGSQEPRPDTARPQATAAAAPEMPDVSADLPALARDLIPEGATDHADEELAVEECGIAPVYPCVRAYFLIEDVDLAERIRLHRTTARAAGWRIVAQRQDPSVTLELERKPYHATYMVEADDPLLCELATRCVAGTMLTVVAPPTPLPEPSEEERALWTAEKTTFVRRANAVCDQMLIQARANPDAFAETLASASDQLTALHRPAGEDEEVERMLAPLRNLVKAARALSDDRGEDALPAAVAVAEFAKRFNRTAAAYGLDRCARVG